SRLFDQMLATVQPVTVAIKHDSHLAIICGRLSPTQPPAEREASPCEPHPIAHLNRRAGAADDDPRIYATGTAALRFAVLVEESLTRDWRSIPHKLPALWNINRTIYYWHVCTPLNNLLIATTTNNDSTKSPA